MQNKFKTLTDDQRLYQVQIDNMTAVVPQQKNKHYVFNIDVSGSMYYELNEIKTHLANQIAASLQVGDLLSVIYYSSKGDCGYILNRYEFSGIDSLQAAKNAINMLRVRSLTGFVDPIKLTMDILNDQHTNIFVFMSDGHENQNPRSKVIEVTKELSDKIDYGYVIEFGNYANHDLLVEMGDIVGTTLFSKDVVHYNERVTELVGGDFKSTYSKVAKDNIDSIFYIQNGFVIQPKLVDDQYYIPEGVQFYILANQDATVDILGFSEEVNELNEGLLGLIYLNQADSKSVWNYLGQLGSVSLIDQYGSSVGQQKLSQFNNTILELIKDDTSLFAEGRDYNYLPDENEFCLLDLLNVLDEDDDLKIFTRDDRFSYNRIGAKSVQTTSQREENPYTLNFEYKDQIEKGSGLDLVYNSSRANISFRVKQDVIVDLSPVGDDSIPQKVDSFIFRNYTIVNDLVLNIRQLVVTCSEETLNKLPDNCYTVENGRVLIDLTAMPIANRSMIKDVSLANLAQSYVENKLLAFKQKVFNTLAKDHEVKKVDNPIIDQYGEEVADKLKTHGITSGGFNPAKVKLGGEDMYYAPSIVGKVAKYSTVPTLSKVVDKVAVKGENSLTPTESVLYGEYKNYLDFINSDFYKNSSDQESLLLNYIATEQKNIRNKKRGILFNTSKNIFTAILSKAKIEDETFTVNYNDVDYSVSIVENTIEVKI